MKKSEFQWSSDLINNYHLVVSVIADQSNISIGDFNVEKLDIQLNNSIMKAGNYSFGTISGNLKNGSVFTIGRFKKISLECDSISNYEMKN